MDYSTDNLTPAEADFRASHPKYATTDSLGRLRETEYARLDRLGHTYLDYTGGGQYAESQIRSHLEWLDGHVLGNPHSHNPSSLAATQYVDEARAAVHEFFSADPEEYDVVFTQNASHALKLVGEAYPFEPGSCYLVSYDNHNSVNGIREFARRKGADVVYVPVRKPDLQLDEDLVMRGLETETTCPSKLFAYPAQSNFSGVQHPLEWVEIARAKGWDVVLDTAAFAPTNRLDLSTVKPDFAVVSFYKMFGYPTGVGALIARRETLAKLDRPWFAGGTITQCLAPMASIFVFHRQRDYFGISVCLCWLATNLWGVATYCGDARALQLPLVAPGMGLMPSGDGSILHDWNHMLGVTGLLRHDTTIALLFQIAAVASMGVGLVFGGWLLWRMAKPR